MSLEGENMKRLRREKGISQEKLAELAGLSLADIAEIEDEGYNATMENSMKIATALGVSVEELVRWNP